MGFTRPPVVNELAFVSTLLRKGAALRDKLATNKFRQDFKGNF